MALHLLSFHKLARHDHCSDDRVQVKAKAKLVLASWLVLIKFIRELAHKLINLVIYICMGRHYVRTYLISRCICS